MPTSGTTTYSVSRDDLIEEALMICGVLEEGETPSADMIAEAARTLSLMTKAMMVQGVKLWGLQEATGFLTEAQASYSLSSSGDRITADLVSSALTADAAAAATSLSLVSTGMAASDIVGIKLDSGAMHWTTVATVPSAASITIATGLASAAATANAVYAFTTKIARPLRISSVRIWVDGIESPLTLISRQEYFDLPDKASAGRPTLAYYDPQLSAGKLYFWPVPDGALYQAKITCERPLEDFSASTNNPDFPIEWGEPLVLMLAERLCRKYPGISLEKRLEVKQAAREALDLVQFFDTENTSLFITPDYR